MTTLSSTGYNSYGQLGLGDNDDRDVFTQISADDLWLSVACGAYHTMAVKNDGTLWAVGANAFGSLGLGDSDSRNMFTQVGTLTTWASVACGQYCSFAITSDGALWATGRNSWGQLGLGDDSHRNVFVRVGSEKTWGKLDSGQYHTVAIKTDGTLWGTGTNAYGQLGLSSLNYTTSFTQIDTDTTWSLISCGLRYSLANKTDGTLWSTGSNDEGQLGLVDNTDRDEFTQIGSDNTWNLISCAKDGSHSLAIKTDYTLWGTGRNLEGQLGLGDNSNRNTFTQIEAEGYWIYANSGQSHSTIINSNNVLYSTGANSYGGLGLGDEIDRNTFTFTGALTAALTYNIVGSFEYTFLYEVKQSDPVEGKHRGIMGINGGVLFNEKTIIGDSVGKLYALNMDTYTDGGNTITRTRRTQIINKERLNVIYNKIEINFQTGVGISGGDDPEVILKWSDDGGNTWSDGVTVSIGEYQEYLTRAIWRRLGKSRNRIFELTTEAPVKFVVLGAYSEILECKF